MGFSWNSSRSVARERQHARMSMLRRLTMMMTMTLLFLAGLGSQAAAQFAPEALPYPSTGRYVGTIVDSVDGVLSTDETITFISATQLTVPPDSTGTYTYTKTGPSTASMVYHVSTHIGQEFQQHQHITAQLTFTSAGTGTYTSAGNYSGEYYGAPFGGTLSNGTGAFTFKTAPVVTTPTSTAVLATTATLGGTVAADGGAAVTQRGVVHQLEAWGNAPVLGGPQATNLPATGTTGPFTVNATGLLPGSAYVFRAYATNAIGTTYSTAATFTTPPTAPTVSSPTSSSITDRRAYLGGSAAPQGSPITEYGAVYAQTAVNADPAIGGAGVTKATTTPDAHWTFQVEAAPLLPATQYSFRAFATNAVGTTYTTPVSTFTTTGGQPEMASTPAAAANILSTGATLGGTLVATGGVITERGVVLARTATNPSPAIGGTGVTKSTATGSGVGAFSTAVSGLQAATAYSYRAYATNSFGTTYTATGTFTTLGPPDWPHVTTPTSASITSTTAVLGAHVVSDGNLPLSAVGILCAPTSAGTPTFGGAGVLQFPASAPLGTGIFTVNATGLMPNKAYHFRAYATNSLGTNYTAPLATFSTGPGVPTMATTSMIYKTGDAVQLGGEATQDNGAPLTERGVVWALTATNSNPVIGGAGVTKSVSTDLSLGTAYVQISGLTPNTSYTFKAYATNSVGTAYTEPATTFTTATMPAVTAPTVANITATGALLGGTRVTDGGSYLWEQGVVLAEAAVNADPVRNGTGVTLQRMATRQSSARWSAD